MILGREMMMLEQPVQLLVLATMECDDRLGLQHRFVQLQFITLWQRPEEATQSFDVARLLQNLSKQTANDISQKPELSSLAVAHLTHAGHLLLRKAEAGQCFASGCCCGAAIAAAAAQVQAAGIDASAQATAAAQAHTHAHATAATAAAAAAVVRQHIEIIVIIACAVVIVVQRNHRPTQPRRAVGRRVPRRQHCSRIGRSQIVEICGGMLKHISGFSTAFVRIRYGTDQL